MSKKLSSNDLDTAMYLEQMVRCRKKIRKLFIKHGGEVVLKSVGLELQEVEVWNAVGIGKAIECLAEIDC